MYLTVPQIMSLFQLVFMCPKGSKFELLDQGSSGLLTLRATNGWGERGFEIAAEGGSPVEVLQMRTGIDISTALEGGPPTDETLEVG